MAQRKYQPVWNRLKESVNNTCFVQVHKLIVARVVKAVIKEKDKDLVFKMANDKNPCRLAIKRIPLSDGKHIRVEFTLKSMGLDDIKKEPEL